MSLNEASDKLGWSRGRLDRYERDEWRLPDASHVRDLVRIYQASDSERTGAEPRQLPCLRYGLRARWPGDRERIAM